MGRPYLSMKLSKDLVLLDLETTGVWVEKDRIIEIALIKCCPAKTRQTYHKKINPGIPIPKIVTELTGISNADVKDAPNFRALSKEILDFIGNCDLAGFNIERFDLPLLEREFYDVGMKFEWKSRKIYDAQKVFHLNEKRDLSAAYKFYCNKDLIGAHTALADTEAVYEILAEQIKKYGDGDPNLSVLDKFEYTANSDFYDAERKFCWWNGKLYPTFGKYARKQPLEDLVKNDANYLHWILKSDFSDGIKDLVKAALEGRLPVKS